MTNNVNAVDGPLYFKADGVGDGTDCPVVPEKSRNIGIGSLAKTGGESSIAIGLNSQAEDLSTIAIGSNSLAIVDTAIGAVDAKRSIAIGAESRALNEGAVAVGPGAAAGGQGALAIGGWFDKNRDGQMPLVPVSTSPEYEVTWATGDKSTAIGTAAYAEGKESVALGWAATTESHHSIVIGSLSVADRYSLESVVIGYGSTVGDAPGCIIIGSNSRAYNPYNVSIGFSADCEGGYDNVIPETLHGSDNIAIGHSASIIGDASHLISNAISVGSNSSVEKSGGIALGGNSLVTAENCIAIGYGSLANEDNSVSFGSPDLSRRLTSVASGVNPSDAVNMSQLQVLQDQINALLNKTSGL